MTMPKSIVLWFILSVYAGPLFGQCEGRRDFAGKPCEVQSAKSDAAGSGESDALATDFSDVFILNMLPPTLKPTSFKSLTTLIRFDDGSFFLRPGIYESFVEYFSLDPEMSVKTRSDSFYAAPLEGGRARIIGKVLRLSGVHPEISHEDIQKLLSAIIEGKGLGQMPAQLQHIATNILGHEDALELQRPAARKIAKKYEPSEMGKEFSAGNHFLGQSWPLPPRGTWVEMPRGFYVRYLPQSRSRIRIQVIVPDTIVFNNDISPVGFNPTEYIAVSWQTPAQRLGISMRAAH